MRKFLLTLALLLLLLPAGARRLLTTMKDLVKLRRLSFPLPCAALEINIRFRRGERELWERLSLIASGNPSN